MLNDLENVVSAGIVWDSWRVAALVPPRFCAPSYRGGSDVSAPSVAIGSLAWSLRGVCGEPAGRFVELVLSFASLAFSWC